VTKAFSIPETRSSRLKLRTIVPAHARSFFFSGWPEADEETYCSRLAWHAGLDPRVENSILKTLETKIRSLKINKFQFKEI
jgi:hypothetical protein